MLLLVSAFRKIVTGGFRNAGMSVLMLLFPLLCAAQTGAISGSITSEVGNQPLAGVWVSVFDYQTESFIGGDETDASGVYLIQNLNDGSYRIEVQGTIVNGSHYAGEYYNNIYVRSEAQEVIVSNGATTRGIDCSLAPGGTITGTVTSDPEGGGKPLAGLIVDASNISNYEWSGGSETDANGFYSITTLPGSYILDVHDGNNYQPEYYKNSQGWDHATPVTVTEGNTTSAIDFSLGINPDVAAVLMILFSEDN